VHLLVVQVLVVQVLVQLLPALLLLPALQSHLLLAVLTARCTAVTPLQLATPHQASPPSLLLLQLLPLCQQRRRRRLRLRRQQAVCGRLSLVRAPR
jgi:hypothetical protein